MARATQRPQGNGNARDAEIGPVSVWGEGERDMGWEGRPKAPSNSPVGSGNQSPWSGEPWANHGRLATGSRENDLNSGTAVRCPQG